MEGKDSSEGARSASFPQSACLDGDGKRKPDYFGGGGHPLADLAVH